MKLGIIIDRQYLLRLVGPCSLNKNKPHFKNKIKIQLEKKVIKMNYWKKHEEKFWVKWN